MATYAVAATLFSELKDKIQAREACVAVVGLGYVGLPVALAFARQAAAEKRPLRITSDVTERIRDVSPDLFASFRRKLEPKARGQLAPWRIVDGIEAACTLPKEAALAREREYFIECRDSPQRKALVHVFFAEREARKIPGLGADVSALPIRRAAVIGAGTMGAGIAMTFANAGLPVSVLELSGAALERGLGLIARNYDGSVARGSLRRERADQALALIHGVTEYEALGGADIVIEAVFEEMKVKQEVFARLDQVAADKSSGPRRPLFIDKSCMRILIFLRCIPSSAICSIVWETQRNRCARQEPH